MGLGFVKGRRGQAMIKGKKLVEKGIDGAQRWAAGIGVAVPPSPWSYAENHDAVIDKGPRFTS